MKAARLFFLAAFVYHSIASWTSAGTPTPSASIWARWNWGGRVRPGLQPWQRRPEARKGTPLTDPEKGSGVVIRTQTSSPIGNDSRPLFRAGQEVWRGNGGAPLGPSPWHTSPGPPATGALWGLGILNGALADFPAASLGLADAHLRLRNPFDILPMSQQLSSPYSDCWFSPSPFLCPTLSFPHRNLPALGLHGTPLQPGTARKAGFSSMKFGPSCEIGSIRLPVVGLGQSCRPSHVLVP